MRGWGSRFIRFVPALAVGASALVFAAPGAQAAGTAATFQLTGGSLSITQPATASLGSTGVGATTLSGSLGSVSVTDSRGLVSAIWTASAVSTAFTTGGATSNETVAATNIAYSAGTATTTGSGTFTATPLSSMAVSSAVGAWTGVGINSATWNPTITFTFLPTQVSGTYSGTITHSVA